MAAIAATGTPETSRRDPTKSAYKVKAVVPADIVRRPSLMRWTAPTLGIDVP
jgi:hypothetical protein